MTSSFQTSKFKLAYSAEAASAAKAGQTSNFLNFDFCLPAAASAKAGCLNFATKEACNE